MQENVEHLEQLYVEFEATQKQITARLDNAEQVLNELDQLNEDTQLADHYINKFKVNKYCLCFTALCRYMMHICISFFPVHYNFASI